MMLDPVLEDEADFACDMRPAPVSWEERQLVSWSVLCGAGYGYDK